MAPKIIWRYRRKRHSSSAANSRKQERGFGTVESQAAGGQQMQRLEQKDHQTRVQFQEEEAQAKVQLQEEEEAQAKLQFQEEEEEAQAKIQLQEEEEEAAQTKVQLQEEEEAQTKLQFQEEEEETQAKTQLQEEEEEAVQTKVQLQEEEEAQVKVQLQEEEEAQPKPEPVSRRSRRLIRSVAKSGFRGNFGSYPFQHRIQAAFGRHDVSNVKAFSDAAAKQANRRIGSLAYASREKVAFRGYPDLHTAAHEAAHIIQQRQGVRLKDGAGKKGDPFERHADAVADGVVRGKSVQSLLNRTPSPGGS